LQHGNRLMIPERSPLNHFRDMLGTGWWIGYFADNQADAETLQKYADAYNVGQNIRLFEIVREQNAIYAMVVEENIKAIYGDNLRLLALIRDYDEPETVRLLDGWYGDVMPIAFAVPRNDADFRALVDSTLQDLAQDGTYQSIWATNFNLGDPLPILAWPQSSPDEPVE
jgi:ABC-type amino acid transport substrate-binding protein